MVGSNVDKTTITLIFQINNDNTYNFYISSKNLLMFTPCNCCKSSQNLKKEQRFWIKKIFEKCLFLYAFLIIIKQARIFLNFFSQWFLFAQHGGFLIRFSWFSFSESISISILLIFLLSNISLHRFSPPF